MKMQPPSNQSIKNSALLLIGNIALVFIAVYCTFGALLSSFSISVDMILMFWIWFLSAIAVSTAVTLYRVKALPVFIIPALLFLLWFFSDVINGGMWVINKITETYSNWLSITVLFLEAKDVMDEPTAFIAAAGYVVTILVSVAICLRRSIFITALITAPVVFLTFIITDMQADIIYLFGLIAVYLTLLASSTLAPDDYRKRGVLTIPAFAITLVFMFLVYFLTPYTNYTRSDNIITLGNNFRTLASQMGRFGQYWQGLGESNLGVGWAGIFSGGTWQFNTNNVNISDAGARYISNVGLIEVNSDTPGTFYIRGYSMGDFSASSWNKDPAASSGFMVPYITNEGDDVQAWLDLRTLDEITRSMPAHLADLYATINPDNAPISASMTIRKTGDFSQGITYSPYYNKNHSAGVILRSTRETFFYVENVHKLHEELTEHGFLPGVHYGTMLDNDWIHRSYTYVDENTAQGLRRLADEAGINPNADRASVVDAVAGYIISSGSYTLSPGPIPRNVDFALYFLEELKEGYCIHFATAAVLMLRSLDIPARFTSGYVATVVRSDVGSYIELTDSSAHAWVEVYYNDIGWLYLEVTPSGGDSNVPRSRPHVPPSNVSSTPDPTPPPIQTPPPEDILPTPDGNRPVNTPPPEVAGSGGLNVFGLPVWVYNIVATVLYIVIIIAAILIRRTIIKHIRAKNFNQRNTNKAAIYIWRYIKILGRREIVPPNDIEDLVLKARFSQHRLTEEERSELIKYATRLAYEIYNGKGDYARVWLKYIRALC